MRDLQHVLKHPATDCQSARDLARPRSVSDRVLGVRAKFSVIAMALKRALSMRCRDLGPDRAGIAPLSTGWETAIERRLAHHMHHLAGNKNWKAVQLCNYRTASLPLNLDI